MQYIQLAIVGVIQSYTWYWCGYWYLYHVSCSIITVLCSVPVFAHFTQIILEDWHFTKIMLEKDYRSYTGQDTHSAHTDYNGQRYIYKFHTAKKLEIFRKDKTWIRILQIILVRIHILQRLYWRGIHILQRLYWKVISILRRLWWKVIYLIIYSMYQSFCIFYYSII